MKQRGTVLEIHPEAGWSKYKQRGTVLEIHPKAGWSKYRNSDYDALIGSTGTYKVLYDDHPEPGWLCVSYEIDNPLPQSGYKKIVIDGVKFTPLITIESGSFALPEAEKAWLSYQDSMIVTQSGRDFDEFAGDLEEAFISGWHAAIERERNSNVSVPQVSEPLDPERF